MIIMLLALLLATLAFPCVLMPEQVWKAFNVGDDVLDCGMHDVNLVALSELYTVVIYVSRADLCCAPQGILFATLVLLFAWRN